MISLEAKFELWSHDIHDSEWMKIKFLPSVFMWYIEFKEKQHKAF